MPTQVTLRPLTSLPLSDSTERTARQIALAMYGSERAVERLPRVTVYEPHENVWIVYTSERAESGGLL